MLVCRPLTLLKVQVASLERELQVDISDRVGCAVLRFEVLQKTHSTPKTTKTKPFWLDIWSFWVLQD